MPATGPLRGLRVVDFTHFVAGPYATLILADGPTGVRVARHIATRGCPVLFITANTKRVPADFAGACGVMSKPYSEHGVITALAFLNECVRTGHAHRRPPQGLTLSPAYARLWGVDQAA